MSKELPPVGKDGGWGGIRELSRVLSQRGKSRTTRTVVVKGGDATVGEDLGLEASAGGRCSFCAGVVCGGGWGGCGGLKICVCFFFCWCGHWVVAGGNGSSSHGRVLCFVLLKQTFSLKDPVVVTFSRLGCMTLVPLS